MERVEFGEGIGGTRLEGSVEKIKVDGWSESKSQGNETGMIWCSCD